MRNLALLALVGLLVACGPSARVRSLNTTLTGVDAMRTTFHAFDDAAQTLIVERATSLEGGKADFAKYVAAREGVLLAFELAYRAIALGYADKADLAEVLVAAQKLNTAFAALKAWQGEAP